jgi:DNA-binding transcriptional regulator YiaG
MERTLNQHNCQQSLVERIATTESPYHFDDCGLPNVYLNGMKYYICALCRKIVKIEIPALKELMDAIAVAVIEKPAPLTGKQIQFLRKRLAIRAVDFAHILSVSPEQLSRWENGRNAFDGAVDRLVRIAYTFTSRDERLRGVMEKVKHQFLQWATSIHGSGANERIVAERVANRQWRAEAELVAA